jgi:hypothetical protein
MKTPTIRTCNCCGKAKILKAFSHSGAAVGYAKHCRECGVWLALFRKAFGKVRDEQLNRERTRERMRL